MHHSSIKWILFLNRRRKKWIPRITEPCNLLTKSSAKISRRRRKIVGIFFILRKNWQLSWSRFFLFVCDRVDLNLEYYPTSRIHGTVLEGRSATCEFVSLTTNYRITTPKNCDKNFILRSRNIFSFASKKFIIPSRAAFVQYNLFAKFISFPAKPKRLNLRWGKKNTPRKFFLLKFLTKHCSRQVPRSGVTN